MAKPFFQDVSGQTAPEPELWEPVIFTQEEIDAEAERLASLPRPANGRRESLFVHPRSTEPGLGLLPGIRVTLSVLRPGVQVPGPPAILASRASVPDPNRVPGVPDREPSASMKPR